MARKQARSRLTTIAAPSTARNGAAPSAVAARSVSNRGLASLFRMAKGDDKSCPECDEELHRKAGPGRDANEVPPIVHEILRSPGRPLDDGVRTDMERRFGGADFSGVRVHTDSRAAESAEAVNAKAYTVGQDVVFGRSSSSMPTPLLAHELTHTLQQRTPVRVHSPRQISIDSDSATEVEAQQTSARVKSTGVLKLLANSRSRTPSTVSSSRELALMRQPHWLPEGPYHPPVETGMSCTALDDCSSLSTKLNYLRHTIQRHQEWDIAHPDPAFPDGRHATEIDHLMRALRNCQGHHNQRCTGQPVWEPVTERSPASEPDRDVVVERVKAGLFALRIGVLIVATIVGLILAAPAIAAALAAVSVFIEGLALGAGVAAAVLLLIKNATTAETNANENEDA